MAVGHSNFLLQKMKLYGNKLLQINLQFLPQHCLKVPWDGGAAPAQPPPAVPASEAHHQHCLRLPHFPHSCRARG